MTGKFQGDEPFASFPGRTVERYESHRGHNKKVGEFRLTPDRRIRWMRDQAGRLIFYKHNLDLYSDELADEGDEIIVLKAIVRIRTKTIVAFPIDRQMINEPDAGDWSLGRMNEDAIHAAEIREREIARPPRIVARPPADKLPEGLPAQVITAGPAPCPECGAPEFLRPHCGPQIPIDELIDIFHVGICPGCQEKVDEPCPERTKSQ